MLKQRVLTALILIPLALLAIIKTTPLVFTAIMAVSLLMAAWEWSNLAGFNRVSARLGYLLLVLIVMQAVMLVPINLVLLMSLIWWLYALTLLVRYNQQQITIGKTQLAIAGLFVLLPCWLSLSALKHIEPHGSIILALMLLIWGADTGAYFAGIRWGKRKLAVQISPNKSYAGVYGALITTAFITLIFCVSQKMTITHSSLLVLTTGFITLAAIVGDLFESMLKRQRGIKDSGKMLPGHGGLLDRIDSLTAAAPLFALGVFLFTRVGAY